MIFGIKNKNERNESGLYFASTKTLNHYLNIEGQTPDEIQSLEKFKNITVVFDDTLLSKHASKTGLFYTRERNKPTNFYFISRSYFHLPKITTRKNSSVLFYTNSKGYRTNI